MVSYGLIAIAKRSLSGHIDQQVSKLSAGARLDEREKYYAKIEINYLTKTVSIDI